jgi:hypothetical protein
MQCGVWIAFRILNTRPHTDWLSEPETCLGALYSNAPDDPNPDA